jgi:enolase-phosphatase E1
MYILTDIEGTTTDIAFVHTVLFPYSRERMESYCYDNSEDAAVKACLDEVHAMLTKITGRPAKRQDPFDYLLHCIDADIKDPALKTLQGLIWRTGYENGTLKGHIYDDVVPALAHWKTQNIGLGVYSSGSVAAQKLLFGYSVFGDITPYFSDYFDTKVGHKREQASYENIAKSLGLSPNEILFLSDIEAELDAAQAAGLQTVQLVREGTVASERHRTVGSFSEI